MNNSRFTDTEQLGFQTGWWVPGTLCTHEEISYFAIYVVNVIHITITKCPRYLNSGTNWLSFSPISSKGNELVIILLRCLGWNTIQTVNDSRRVINWIYETTRKQTPHFRTYSRRALYDLPETLHGDRGRRKH